MERLWSQGQILARIGGLAGLYRLDLDPIYKPLATLGDALAAGAILRVPHSFDRIAIAIRANRERLGDAVDAAQLRRLDRLAPGVSAVEVELEAGKTGVAASLSAMQTRSHEALRADVEALGAGSTALARWVACGEQLGTPIAIEDRADVDGALHWTLHFRHANQTDRDREATRTRLLEVADLLGVTKPQRSIIDGLHDVLAKQADSEALLSIGAEQSAPVLAVRWQRVRWETVVRMMLGFYPRLDAGKRLGELAGAFDAEHASAMEITFGPSEPPATRIAVAI